MHSVFLNYSKLVRAGSLIHLKLEVNFFIGPIHLDLE